MEDFLKTLAPFIYTFIYTFITIKVADLIDVYDRKKDYKKLLKDYENLLADYKNLKNASFVEIKDGYLAMNVLSSNQELTQAQQDYLFNLALGSNLKHASLYASGVLESSRSLTEKQQDALVNLVTDCWYASAVAFSKRKLTEKQMEYLTTVIKNRAGIQHNNK